MDNVAFTQQWFDQVWNKKEEAAIYRMFSKAGIAHGLLDEEGKEIVGPEKLAAFFRKFVESFPDIHVRIDDAISEGEKIAVRTTVSMTHNGKFFQAGPNRIVQPPESKTKIEFTGSTFSIIRDGQIQEAWNNYDFLSMYLQLGAVDL